MATSIGSYSVGLSLDASGYIQGGKLSRAETAAIVRQINAARDPTEKYTRSMNQLEKALETGAIDQKVYNRLAGEAAGQLRKVSDAAKDTAKTHQSFTSQAVAGIGRLAAAYLSFQTVKKAISLGIEVEQAEVQLEVLTNSANNAKVLMSDLRDFAALSPVSFTGATDAAKTMLMFNVGVQDVMRNVKMLGDVTGGNAERFQSMTLAFSQMNSAGRLMGQDLLQMINAGFNPLQQISKTTGESITDLKKRMEDGGISTQEVTQAFADATSEGGMFHGMTERMADTMGGKLTIAMSDLELAAISLSESLSPLIIQLTDGFSEGLAPLNAMLYMVEWIADGWGLVAAAAQDAASAVADVADRMMGGKGNGRVPMEHMFEFLDLRDKRDQERAARAAEAASGKARQLEVPEVAASLPGFGDKLGGLLDGAVEGLRSKLNNPSTFDVIPDAVSQGLGQAYQVMEQNARALQIADAEIAKLTSGTPLAKSAAEGSEAAYSIIVGAQNNSAAKQLAESQRQTALMAAHLKAQEEANAIAEAKENPFAGVM